MHTKGSPQIETVSIFRTHLRWYIRVRALVAAPADGIYLWTGFLALPNSSLLSSSSLLPSLLFFPLETIVIVVGVARLEAETEAEASSTVCNGIYIESDYSRFIGKTTVHRVSHDASCLCLRLSLRAMRLETSLGQRRSQYWTDLLGSHRLQVDRSGTLDQYTMLIFSVPALPAISCCDSSCGELISSRRIRVDTDLSLGFRSVRNAARPLPLPAVW